jgi:hypothetical protein
MATIQTLFRNGNVALRIAGIFHVGLFAICLALSFIDPRTVTGLNPWIKPMKFCLSIAFYTFSFSILLGLVDGFEKMCLWIGRGIAATMYVEIICITLQAARGVTSHYNITTSFDSTLFAVMGAAIALNTIFDSFVFGLFVLTPQPMGTGVLWGIRFGLMTFIAAGFVGGMMIMNQAHTIGAADGGAGLPFVNWSTKNGDLRVAHFLGMHGIQILPLFGLMVDRIVKVDAVRAGIVTVAAAGFAWFMWWQTQVALAGQPFIAR